MSPITDLITHRSQSSLMMGIGAVFAGMASAGLHGNTEFLPATLCLLFVCFAQLAGNYYYQYFDERNHCGNSIDSHIANATRLSSKILKEFSFGMMLMALMVGFTLAAMGGWWVIVVGIIIFLISWAACGGPHPLLRTPYGILTTFLLFGPICVITTSLIQSSHETTVMINWFDLAPSIFMSVVIGLMAVNANLLYSYSTFLTDLKNSKKSFVNQLGRKTTRALFLINGVIYTAVSIFMCINLHLDMSGVDMIPSFLCLAIDLYIWWKMRTMQRYRLKELVPLGTFNVLLMGILSYILFELTGVPDDSKFTFFGIG